MIKILTQQEHRINRNIVECKYIKQVTGETDPSELIETLWNVNSTKRAYHGESCTELIETLWNVNALHSTKCFRHELN